MKKVIIYYTDNKLDKNIASFCFENLLKVCGIIPIVLVSQKRTSFLYKGEIIVGDKSKSRQSMFEQIQSGLQVAKRIYQPDIVFMAEHDILYSKGYFDFIPPDNLIFYYANNKYWMDDSKFVDCMSARHLSVLACNFNLLLSHINWRLYRMQYLNMKKGGLTKSEPGCSEVSQKFNTLKDPTGENQYRYLTPPCVDIRHGNNLSKVNLDEYIKKYGNKIYDTIPYWGNHTKLKEKMKWV